MNQKLRPYMSVDIEGTASKGDLQVLEIGAVIDDGVSPLDELKTFHAIIYHDKITCAEPFALNMNARIIEILAKDSKLKPDDPKRISKHVSIAMREFVQFTEKAKAMSWEWDKKHGKESTKGRVLLAAKNGAFYDLPHINRTIKEVSEKLFYRFDRAIKNYNMLDTGPMYFRHYGYMPSSSEIKKDFLKEGEVSHHALEDAFDNVKAIRRECNI